MSRARKIELELATFSQSLIDAIRWHQDLMLQTVFPSPKWREDPVGFFRDVLCVDPWQRQRDILEACVLHDKIAVKSGRRVGKSVTISGLALWRWASFERGQALLTSATKDQLDRVLWAEITKMYHQAGVCIECKRRAPETPAPCPHSAKLIGYMNRSSKGGLRSPDKAGLRTVHGKTAKSPAALAGWGSPDMITLIDEVEGLTPEVIDMLIANLASGGVLAAFGNPLNPRGAFASFFKQGSDWHQITISSKETPNYQSGQMLVPGLATRRWVDGITAENTGSENSAYVQSMILGQFPDVDLSGSPISLAKIKQANAVNETAQEFGPLYIGLDVASYSEDGRNDVSVFSVGCGNKHLDLVACDQYREHELVEKLIDLIEQYRTHAQQVIVNMDVAGIGYKLADKLMQWLDTNGPLFQLNRIRNNERAKRENKIVYNRRDEAFHHLVQYVDGGGGLLVSRDLEEQLPLHSWIIRNTDGLATLPDKAKIRRTLKRSPDHADAVMLMCLRGEHSPGTPMGSHSRTAAPSPSQFAAAGGPGSRYEQQRRRRGF